jgi:hypothetical protein
MMKRLKTGGFLSCVTGPVASIQKVQLIGRAVLGKYVSRFLFCEPSLPETRAPAQPALPC